MPDEPADISREEITDEQGIRRLEAEAAFRQSNVLPVDAAMNEGRFYGLLIRRGPLGGVQRLGFFFVGIMLAGFALMQICFIFPRLSAAFGLPKPAIPASAASILFLPIDAILCAVGIKLIMSALVPKRRRSE